MGHDGEDASAPPEQASSAKGEEVPAPEEPDYTDLEVCRRTFFAPYGNLIYAEGWESYEDLGSDTLFQFTV